MKKRKAIKLGLACVLAVGAVLTGRLVRAQTEETFACIERYVKLGISPESAMKECRTAAVVKCIEEVQKALSLNAISGPNSEGRYLIDLREMTLKGWEGNQWRQSGCEPNTEGPSYYLAPEGSIFGSGHHEWFRQGWCTTQTIQFTSEEVTLGNVKADCQAKHPGVDLNHSDGRNVDIDIVVPSQ